MYSNIMVPVDLNHLDKLEKALKVAGDLAKHYAAKLHFVAVTTSAPTELAHNPAEFAQKLERFAADQAAAFDITAEAHPAVSHDPSADLDATVRRVGEAIDADLVVMASHVPGFADHIFRGHGNYMATHSDLSVFIVR